MKKIINNKNKKTITTKLIIMAITVNSKIIRARRIMVEINVL